MKCECGQDGEKITLCDLHQKEFKQRMRLVLEKVANRVDSEDVWRNVPGLSDMIRRFVVQ